LAVVAFGALGPLAPTAQANLPPGAGCDPTPAPGTGTFSYEVSATLPAAAPVNANGVCINCTGTGGANNSATLVQNAAGCGATQPTVGAGSSYVWADWGTNNCVAPGNTVKIRFKSGPPPAPAVSVKWNLQTGATYDGTGSISGPVGGIAELPDMAGGAGDQAAATDSGSGWSSAGYAALAGGLAAAAVVLSAGAWYARRRLLR